MTPSALSALIGGLLAIAFLLAFAVHTLRDFSRSRLDDICRRHENERRFGEILRQYELVLLACDVLLLLSTLAVVALAIWFRAFWIDPEAAGWEWVRVAAKLLAMAGLLLFWLVVLPWTLGRVAGEPFLYRAWPVLSLLAVVLRPVLAAATGFDRILHRASGVEEPGAVNGTVLTDEIRTVVDEGQREGVIESDAHTMIQRVIELQEEDTAAIMTPRTEMDVIPASFTLEEARQTLLKIGHSRVPVVGETTDDIIGILYAKDLLQYMETPRDIRKSLRDIVREPFYVPETTGIDTLLESMKREKVHIAIVIDEYSGVAGLVTMEDILEEIVGEIVDEYDIDEEAGIYPVSPGIVEVEARVHIDDLNEQFQFDLPEDGDFDTIGGFVFTQLGRVPNSGDSFAFRNLRVTVIEADSRKIHKLRIETAPQVPAPAEPA